MLLKRFVNGRARSNAYVYAPDGGGACVVLDSGVGAAPKIERYVTDQALRPEAVLLTHGHPDHLWTSRALSDLYEIPVLLHPLDWRWFDDPASGGYVPLVRLGGRLVSRARGLRPARLEKLVEGSGLPFDLRILHTPGHTAGSSCLVAGDVCFVGDTVFSAGLGHAFYPGGRRGELVESVRRELLPLGDDVRLLPGHGGETTVAGVRELLERR